MWSAASGFEVMLQLGLLCCPIRWEYCRTNVECLLEVERYAEACEKHALVCEDARVAFHQTIQEICKEIPSMGEPNDAFVKLKTRVFPLIGHLQGRLSRVVADLVADFDSLLAEGQDVEASTSAISVAAETVSDSLPSSPLSVRVEYNAAKGKVVLSLLGELPLGSTGMRIRYELNSAYWDRLCSRHAQTASHEGISAKEKGPSLVALASWRLLHRYQVCASLLECTLSLCANTLLPRRLCSALEAKVGAGSSLALPR
jgi:uncharacterized protein YbaR (Trm112 family)